MHASLYTSIYIHVWMDVSSYASNQHTETRHPVCVSFLMLLCSSHFTFGPKYLPDSSCERAGGWCWLIPLWHPRRCFFPSPEIINYLSPGTQSSLACEGESRPLFLTFTLDKLCSRTTGTSSSMKRQGKVGVNASWSKEKGSLAKFLLMTSYF